MKEVVQPMLSRSPHSEQHFTASDTVRDIVIGMSDGLTVPFALSAGLTGAIDTSSLIVTAGLAEIAAGSVAMGLGGYLAAKTELEHYETELSREKKEIETVPEVEAEEVAHIFRSYHLKEEQVQAIVEEMRNHPEQWVDFMMRFELGLHKSAANRGRKSASIIGLSYAIGGIIPLLPYLLIGEVATALKWSVTVTLIVLFLFGLIKGKFTGTHSLKSAFQTTLIGGIAAGVAFLLARWVS
ncbi:VIT1/CCC1 transporter family protein [Hazenella coriacea]|nr:VIT1/CCC1 transporter family protein [Hazenella coriacea]